MRSVLLQLRYSGKFCSPRQAGEQDRSNWNTQQDLELARGIEPPTCGLQNHCSAIELRQPILFFAHLAWRVKRRAGRCGVVPFLRQPASSQPHGGRRGRLRWVGRSGAMAVTDIAIGPALPRLTMFLVAVLQRSRRSMTVELTAVVVCFQPYESHKCVDQQIVQSDA